MSTDVRFGSARPARTGRSARPRNTRNLGSCHVGADLDREIDDRQGAAPNSFGHEGALRKALLDATQWAATIQHYTEFTVARFTHRNSVNAQTLDNAVLAPAAPQAYRESGLRMSADLGELLGHTLGRTVPRGSPVLHVRPA